MAQETNYTPEMLAALEKAIATGARDVYYGDKRVSYRSLDEMLRTRDIMRQELGIVSGVKRAVYPSFSKGL